MMILETLFDVLSASIGAIMGAVFAFYLNHKRNKSLATKLIVNRETLDKIKLENQSEVNCTVTIHAKFLSADGTVLKTETQSFEGFPAGWQNHFVFMPQIQYDTMEYTLDVKQYTGEMYFTSTSGYVLGEVYEEKWIYFN